MNSKYYFIAFTSLIILFSCIPDKSKTLEKPKPRVIISTDIGGTDPDDNQSMIHYLMYADKFQTEGLISSPYGKGRTTEILRMIDLYEEDLPKLKKHGAFPNPDDLRAVTKQGALEAAPAQGWSAASEGSDWIIEKAKADSDQPLWILVWGGLEDVAQALHDAPEIAEKIRVYWIGGPNKKWSVHSYTFLAHNFPNLWMIEANSTYRGWFNYEQTGEAYENDAFYDAYMKSAGALGSDFINYYDGEIKMGDTPSMAYLLDGDPNDPEGQSWGGSFTSLPFSAFRYYDRHTTVRDTVPTYSVVEWKFTSDDKESSDSGEIWVEIDGQRIDGFYDGDGVYKVRFVPKRIGNWEYHVNSSAKSLDGQTGRFVSANPWPGDENPDNMPLTNWWSDRTEADLYLGEYQGAKTVSRWREKYLKDWARRLSWLEEQ